VTSARRARRRSDACHQQPGDVEIDSINTLEPVLDAVIQAIVSEEKRNAATEARKRVMASSIGC